MTKLCSWGSFSFSFSAALVTEEVGPLTWSGISPNHVYTTLCIQSGKQNDDWLSNSGWITSWANGGWLGEKRRWEVRWGDDNGRTLWWKTRFCKQTKGLSGEPLTGVFITNGETLRNLTGRQKPLRKISWHKSHQQRLPMMLFCRKKI